MGPWPVSGRYQAMQAMSSYTMSRYSVANSFERVFTMFFKLYQSKHLLKNFQNINNFLLN
jgi:hypothetical protein